MIPPLATVTPPAISQLAGRLVLDPVSCAGGRPHGSFLTMSADAKQVVNRSSTCAGGTVTLLPPGSQGLALGAFTPDPAPAFDNQGEARSGAVLAPVSFGGHRFALGSAAEDVQDAPYGPPTFPAPVAYTQQGVLVADLRALHVTFDGHPGTTCRSAVGHGCWLVGSRSARGTYDPATRAFTLDWTAGQGFAGPSASVTFHLSGHLVGRLVSTAPTAVEAPETQAVPPAQTPARGTAPTIGLPSRPTLARARPAQPAAGPRGLAIALVLVTAIAHGAARARGKRARHR